MNSSETPTTAKPAMNFSELPLAYLRPVSKAQGGGFAVCTADGNQLAVFPSREAAFFAAKQHDLQPVMLH